MARKKDRLPNAKEIWAAIPKPALARNELTKSKAGLYVFRLLKGRDIHKRHLYMVETRNIFGMLDNFCSDFTENFDNEADARSFYRTARNEAWKEYDRLKKKQQDRINQWEDENDKQL